MKTAVFALAVVLAAAAVLSTSATLAQSSTQPIFKSSARLVQVSVVVQDRNGKPVPGLTAADFEVVDGGRKHQVAHFAVHSRDRSGVASAPMPAGAFTNVVEGRVGTGATIVLFDRLNTSDIDQIYARRHLVTFLRQLEPDERLGFYVLDGRYLRIIHDFTRDTEALLRLIDGVSKTTSAELAGSEEKFDRPPAMDDGLDEIFEAMIDRSELAMNGFFMEKRADATVDTLEILAERLAGVQGRKNVIWISSAFPLHFNDGVSLQRMSPRVYRATRALSHADVSIYPVDARGLIGGLSGPAGRPTLTTMAQLAPSFDTSSLIAEQTGGRVFRNTNDLRAAMQRAVADADLTYVLGYYPQDERFDGRFRKIEVKVQKDDLSVRHRRGYYAHPPKVAAGLDKDGLIEALQYPIEATSLGMTVTSSAAPDGEVALTMRIDPTGLSLESRDGHWKGQIEVAIGQRLPDNTLQNSAHVVVPLDIPEAMRDALMASGLTLNRSVRLNPQAHLLVVGVRDLKSGAIGTVRIETRRLKD